MIVITAADTALRWPAATTRPPARHGWRSSRSLLAWAVGLAALIAACPAVVSGADAPVQGVVAGTEGVPWSGPAQRTVDDALDPDPALSAPLPADELGRRLSPVSGLPGAIVPAPPDAVPPDAAQPPRATLRGTLRVRGTWRPGSALRVAADDFSPLVLRVWQGREGVAIHYRPQPPYRPPAIWQAWAACRITRGDDGVSAVDGPLLTSDEGRGWRASPAAPPCFELAWTGESLIVAVGGIAVLGVPFSGVPEAIDLHCEEPVALRQLMQMAGIRLPATGRPLAPARSTIDPARCVWTEELSAGASFNAGGDGGGLLRAGNLPAPARVSVPLPRDGLAELVVALDDVTPGSGVYLGDERGRPLFGIAFVADPDGRRTVARGVQQVGARVAAWSSHWGLQPVVGRRLWLRMLPAAGTMKFWVSEDGSTWAALTEVQGPPPRAWSSVGLFCLPEHAETTIRIREITLHPLTPIDDLVPAGLRETAASLPEISDWSLPPVDWRARVEATRPAAAAADAWRRACAIVRLGAGIDEGFGTLLVRSLLEDVLRAPPPADESLRLLDAGVALLPNHGAPTTAQQAADLYVRLGERLRRGGDVRPYTTVASRLAVAPIWSRATYDCLAESLLRAEIIELATAEQWQDLAALCRDVRWHYRGRPIPLVDWAESLARWALEADAGDEPIPWSRSRYAPLAFDVTKSGTGDVIRWQAEMDRGAFIDAYRILGNVGPFALHELLPAPSDDRLLTTWPVAIEAALRRNAELPAAMRPAFPTLAPVRLAQAIDSRDATALDLATVHFCGTPQAARAHLWLGDRHLLLGEPARALGRYRRARFTAPSALHDRIAASECLAEAMLGRASPPVAGGLVAGDERLSAADLAGLAEQTRLAASPGPVAEPDNAPKAAGFRCIDRARFPPHDALVGPPERFVTQGVDLVARHTSCVFDGPRLIVADRGRAVAYELATGGLIWESAAGRDAARPEENAAVPGTALGPGVARPLVSQGRVFLRRLTKAGWVLVCIDAANGRTVWGSDAEAIGAVVSDPVLVEDRLHVVTLSVALANQGVLHLTTIEPREGVVLARKVLARFQEPQRARQAWFDDRHDVGLAGVDDLLVAVGHGAVICCDLSGTPRWVRHEISLPFEIDPSWERFTQDRPLVADDRVIVALAGGWSVVCLDSTNGRLCWQRVVPDMRRVLAVLDGRVIVATDDSFLALDARTGAELWRHESGSRLGGELCGKPGGLIYAISERAREQPPAARPCLVWVDLVSGRPVARWPLEGRERERPVVGPLWGEDGRLWMLEGEATAKQRGLVALLPEGEPQAVRTGLE